MHNFLSTFSTIKWAEYYQKLVETAQLLVESISEGFRFGLVWCFDIKPKRRVHLVLEHWNLWQSAKISQIWTFSVSTNCSLV